MVIPQQPAYHQVPEETVVISSSGHLRFIQLTTFMEVAEVTEGLMEMEVMAVQF